MKHIIAIVDEDERYSEKLCSYMNLKKWIELKAVTFKNLTEYIKQSETFTSEILLINEKEFKNLGHYKKPDTTIVLLEDNICDMETPENIKTVNKYISAEKLLKIIMENYSPTGENILVNTGKIETSVIGVYSPINRCGKTSFSIALAIHSSKKKPTLLISFDEYCGILKKSENHTTDLSDIMYYYKQGKYSWDRLGTVVYSDYGLDYIPPARYSEDILELSINDIGNLIDSISTGSKYENIILDFGSLGKRACELFKLCKKVYMPILTDTISEMRISEFYDYLVVTGRDNLKQKIKNVSLPFPKVKSEQKLHGIENSTLGRYAKEILEEGYD